MPLHAIDNHFCFIDCEGLDVEWSTLETLLSNRGDILLVFQTAEINRVFGKGKSKESARLWTAFVEVTGGSYVMMYKSS